jgi:hypothetical protein
MEEMKNSAPPLPIRQTSASRTPKTDAKAPRQDARTDTKTPRSEHLEKNSRQSSRMSDTQSINSEDSSQRKVSKSASNSIPSFAMGKGNRAIL